MRSCPCGSPGFEGWYRVLVSTCSGVRGYFPGEMSCHLCKSSKAMFSTVDSSSPALLSKSYITFPIRIWCSVICGPSNRFSWHNLLKICVGVKA
ncbi:hypothetical protein X975_16821, partial [Stegodyphus mimosarum]